MAAPHRLFIGGLVPDITKEELEARFRAFGTVDDLEIICDAGGT
jgi:RNA recognition motif-containing protein